MKALLDTTVIVAAALYTHPNHEASLALVETSEAGDLAVSAHAICEAYSRLTSRRGPAPFAVDPVDAIASLTSIMRSTTLIGLTPAQTIENLRLFASSAGIGARLYDHLIGAAAVPYAIAVIVTLNVRHFVGLFPTLHIVTPEQYAAEQR